MLDVASMMEWVYRAVDIAHIRDDMRERDRLGQERYGTPLQAYNGRDPLIDAYQEALDLVAYLKQWCMEQGPRADASRYWDALRLAVSLGLALLHDREKRVRNQR